MVENKLVCDLKLYNMYILWISVKSHCYLGVFIRLKMTSYIAISTLKIHEVSDFSDSQFLEKVQKLICKLPKYFTNCEL